MMALANYVLDVLEGWLYCHFPVMRSCPLNEKRVTFCKKHNSVSPILCIIDDEPDNKKAKSDDQTQVASAAAAAAVGMVPAAIPGAVPMMPMMPVPGMPVPHGFPQMPFGQPIPGGDNFIVILYWLVVYSYPVPVA